MTRAIELAQQGWGQTAPNPLVGAVVARDGTIVSEAFHARFGEAHAEALALDRAGANAGGSTLYVNLEPCAHVGKTPPCVDAIIRAGVKRVVAATRDPNPEAGGGAAKLREAGVEVTLGIGERQAYELNAPFLRSFGAVRPWTTLKLALSLDGALADYSRAPGWLTSERARLAVHHVRAGSDAIAVGMGTVLADDPLLTVRHVAAPRVPPIRVVLSKSGRLPLTSRLAQTTSHGPVVVFAETIDAGYERTLHDLGVELVWAPSLRDAVKLLFQRGVRSLLVEGGCRITTALLTERLIDRLMLFQAPIILGAGALGAFSTLHPARTAEAPRLRVVSRETYDDDLMSLFALDAD